VSLLPILQIDDDSVAVTPATQHEFTLSSKEVARGFGVSPEVIRSHKANHADELIEGKHWIAVDNFNGGADTKTLWTKRGVIRLGFFIRSERAKRFRDAAEDLVLAPPSAQPEARAELLIRTIDALIARGLEPQQAAALAASACAMPRPKTPARPKQSAQQLATQVLLPGLALRYTDLCDRIQTARSISAKPAQQWVTHLRRAGHITRTETGLYTLNLDLTK